MIALLALLACNGTVDDSGVEDTATAPFTPDLATGGCGQAPHDWVPTDRMGEIVAWERDEDASLSAAAIDIVLNAAGAGELTPVANGVDVYRVRYLTQDRGEIVEATGLLAFPDTDGVFPTIGWLHPTTGFNDSCAPSAMGLEGAAGAIIVAAFGYAVAAPDYLGMAGWGEPSGRIHPYIVPEPTAVASLDSLRALWRFQDEVVPDSGARGDTRVGLWGASEGGFAALWADRYGNGYLPEADIVATVASVPPTDLQGLAEHGAQHLGPATGGIVGVLAANHDWYGGSEPLTEIFTDDPPNHIASSVRDVMATECGGPGLFDGITRVDEVLTPAFVDAVVDGTELAPWTCYLERGSLRHAPIPRGSDAPVLFQVSEDDELVVGSVERADAPRLCDAGYEMTYLECAGADHVSGAADSLPFQLDWLRARFDGEPLDGTCVFDPPVDCAAL